MPEVAIVTCYQIARLAEPAGLARYCVIYWDGDDDHKVAWLQFKQGASDVFPSSSIWQRT